MGVTLLRYTSVVYASFVQLAPEVITPDELNTFELRFHSYRPTTVIEEIKLILTNNDCLDKHSTLFSATATFT